MMFSDTVCEKIGNYIYFLIDPTRNDEIFYVGKGTGNRVFDHVYHASKIKNEDSVSLKVDRILSIHNKGSEVKYSIHRHEIPEESIYHVEAALIDAFPNLTNLQGGHGSSSIGPMSTKDIIMKYDLPVLMDNPPHKLVLINVNRSFDNRDLYDATRFAWRLSKSRAEDTNYVLAVVRGVVREIYKPKKWLSATQDNFPDFDCSKIKGRYGFIGEVVTAPEIRDLYVGEHGKRIESNNLKHVQNPIRYWKV